MSLSHLTKAMSLAVFFPPPLCLADVVTSAISTTLADWQIGRESLGSHPNFKSVLLAPSVEVPHGKQCGRGPDSTGRLMWLHQFHSTFSSCHGPVCCEAFFPVGKAGLAKVHDVAQGSLNNVRRKASAGVYIYTWVSRVGHPNNLQTLTASCTPLSSCTCCLELQAEKLFFALNGGCVIDYL